MMSIKKLSALFFAIVLVSWGCSKNGPSGPNPDDFDREAILVNWADNIIISALSNFAEATEELKTAGDTFSANPTQQNLTDLRKKWSESYMAWQHVSMFEMGKAMEIRFRDNLNIYPTDTDEIHENIQEGSYNLELPSLNNSQGFPALDYLLYGIGENDAEILTYYTTHQNAESYRTYVNDLVTRIDTLTDTVLEHWTTGYRDQFVSNSGNGANSALDMMVNDYIFYYEKYLRAGKIGIPAGVFSVSPLSTHVEGYYSRHFSKSLFMESLNAAQNFFNGKHFNSEETGESLSSYLDFLNTMKEGTDLTSLINNQFEETRNETGDLDDSFAEQVESDNSRMLSTYDELQMNVVYMKVDMLQALNINVDYVDADGD